MIQVLEQYLKNLRYIKNFFDLYLYIYIFHWASNLKYFNSHGSLISIAAFYDYLIKLSTTLSYFPYLNKDYIIDI